MNNLTTMPVQRDDNKYYDFEELIFEKDCDVDSIINNFFIKYQEIKGDKEYITYKIKQLIAEDRKFVNELNSNGQNPFNRIGTTSYLRHHVIPEQNNCKEYYIYCITTFI